MQEFDFDDDEFEQLASASTTVTKGPSLKARAIDFLSRREHSRLELSRKLQRHSQDLDEIAAVLDELQQKNWQSDQRYAQSLINRKAHKLGVLRVLQELRQNGVNDEHIDSVREQLKDTEYERALEVWERKFNFAPPDQKAYAKQYRFMVSRGFSPSLLRRILDHFNNSL